LGPEVDNKAEAKAAIDEVRAIHKEWEPNPANKSIVPVEHKSSYSRETHKVTLRSARRKTQADGCGHMLDTGELPRTNCVGCWGHFFIANQKMTVQNIAVLRAGKGDEIRYELGKKYHKNLVGFDQFIEANKEAIAEHEAELAATKEVPVDYNGMQFGGSVVSELAQSSDIEEEVANADLA